MVKGVSIQFKTYLETLPKLLKLIKFDEEIKKYEQIVLKLNLANGNAEKATKVAFIEPIVKFCMEHKNPGTEIFLTEGCDGKNTLDVFAELGYSSLSERYNIGLVDLNTTDVDDIEDYEFLKFSTIKYPTLLLNSFVISVPYLRKDDITSIAASLDNMIGAFPAKHYKGFLSKTKNKLNNYSIEHQIHDILKCKFPDFAIIDASSKGKIFAGQPFEMDKSAAKELGIHWEDVEHLRLWQDSLSGEIKRKAIPVKEEEDK